MITAHADEEKKYAEFAAELRKQVWSENDPDFSNYECPEKYEKSHSAVILASRTDVELTRKSYIQMTSPLQFRTTRQMGRHELNRMLVKINDAAALKKFSEFDYFTFKKSRNGLGLSEKLQQVLGVRVIKQNGEIVTVSTDEYMTTREGAKGKDVSHKLAVPGLEIGDIVDIFTYEEMIIKERNIPPFVFTFVEEYPMLRYKVNCKIDDKFTTQYRTLNGAPDFTATTDEDNNTVLHAEVSNVEAVAPSLWYSEMAQSPMVLLYATDKSVTSSKVKSVKQRGLQANPDFKTILNDDLMLMTESKKHFMWESSLYRKLHNDIIKNSKEITDKEELARNLYTGLLYSYRAFDKYDSYNPYQFIIALSSLFDGYKVPYQFMISTERNSEPLDQLIHNSNTTWLIKTIDGTYFTPPYYKGFTAGTIPFSLQGRKAALINGKLKGEKTLYEIVTLPQSAPDDNLDEVTVNASVDGTRVNIDRTESRTGSMKESLSFVISNQQEFAANDAYLKCNKPYIEMADKKSRTGILQQFEKDKESQKNFFKEEVQLYHDQDAAEFTAYDITSTGIDPKHPDFTYTTHYAMDGWVKKAGSNLIVSIGKLIGDQVKIEGEARKRDFDINRRATQLTWNITLTLPSGYQVAAESLEKLQQNVSNNAGEFHAQASVSDNQLQLVVAKCYRKADYPVAEWQQLLQIIDAANDFTQKQIVLKKQ
ncbi:MAG: DUF3857 domain-containing protein [Muribaculaceae bacterium]|nr:DUF3857 domain-containing protein [Muribaculaceae bacterium]